MKWILLIIFIPCVLVFLYYAASAIIIAIEVLFMDEPHCEYYHDKKCEKYGGRCVGPPYYDCILKDYNRRK